MPARRKRADLRQDNRTARTTGLVVLEDAAVAPPPLPDAAGDWQPETLDGWLQFWQSDAARAVQPSDLAGLLRLFALRNMQAVLLRQALDGPATVSGSQGQPRPHPCLVAALKLEPAIQALEDRYGCSPRARAQLGLATATAALTAADLAAAMAEQTVELTAVDAELLAEWQSD